MDPRAAADYLGLRDMIFHRENRSHLAGRALTIILLKADGHQK
jgi:hypothetical protein